MSLARAAYSGSDIILMDDSLSAVDAHTGKQILISFFLDGPLARKTRILITHALHILGKPDIIYVMKDGAIVEKGTYEVRPGGLSDHSSIRDADHIACPFRNCCETIPLSLI